ncbi:MAG: DUF4835 family protein, partial [Marinoscillum sp.]
LNNRKWTDDEFSSEERINCNIILTMDPNESTPSAGRWGASVQILSSRPVYNASYETVVFNFADRDWQFEYVQSQPLQFNENSFTSNITSLLAYYAYTIIGMDYDSFSELGGTRYFQIANQIVSNAQNSNYSGWTQFNSVRNRYWLSENLMGSNFEPLRKAVYEYHLKGLDVFQEDPEAARNNILNGLKYIQTANRSRPRSILTITFLDAKAEELSQIFKDGNPTQKKESYEILSKLDPSKSDTFKKIIE